MILLCQLQAIHGAHRSDPQGFDRVFEIIDRARGRGEMKHIIYLAEIERPSHILLAKLEARLIAQMRDVLHAAGEQIVGTNHRIALRQ